MYTVKTVLRIAGERLSATEKGNRIVAIRALAEARVQSADGVALVVVNSPDGSVSSFTYRKGKLVK